MDSDHEVIQYKTGQTIDAFISNVWITATIERMATNKQKVLIQCNPFFETFMIRATGTTMQWIDISTETAPINTHTLLVLGNTVRNSYAKAIQPPLYYQSTNGKDYILIPYIKGWDSIHGVLIGVAMYDINRHKEFLLNKNMSRSESSVLDSTNHILYSFNDYDKYTKLDIINKKQTEHKYYYHQTFKIVFSQTNILYLPCPINEIHIIYTNKHFRFDINTNEMIYVADTQIPVFDILSRRYNPFIWVESMKKIFLFCRNSIYYCQINGNKQNKYEWKKFEIILPYKSNNYFVLLVYDSIVMIHYNDHYEKYYGVYCIDLFHQKMFKGSDFSPLVYFSPSYLNPKNIHGLMGNTIDGQLITCNDNMIHFVARKYYKWPTNKYIPKVIKDERNFLAVGYIKKQENEYSLYNVVPFYISMLILKFYSSFH
eukprot:41118_1